MQITAAALVTLLPFLAAAAPAAVAEAAPASSSAAAAPGYFGGLSVRSGSPVHLRSIDASGQAFYIGKPTTSYCPSETIGCQACPPGNTTVFGGGDNSLYMGVVVPGGQFAYVTKEGALGFTQAHSQGVPAGAVTTGFSYKPGKPYGSLSWGNGFVACPTKEDKNVYQVYGISKTIKAPSKNCLGFDFLIPAVDSPGAWQYI